MEMGTERLSTDYLANHQPAIALPSDQRDTRRAGIVHFGIGAFCRAHLAAYTDTVMNTAGGDWSIIGVSLRHQDVQQQLAPQDGLYTLVEQGPPPTQDRIIGAVSQVLVAPDNPVAVLDALVDPNIRIVSLTITEKGYCYHPASGELNLQHPDIQWDLAHLDQPRTAIGFIVAGLVQRFARGLPAYTTLCCDNLPDNGALLRRLVLSFAHALDQQTATGSNTVDGSVSHIATQIEAQGAFPSTMVDRIVPATTPDDRLALSQRMGYEDHAMVKTEVFKQWVIEDQFCQDRPAWEQAGALLVDDVAPFEAMKLRLLNGSHSAMAYLGCACGIAYVHEVVAQPALNTFVTDLLALEIAPTLKQPAKIDLAEYQQSLLKRFSNAALKHRTDQIAMDGSQKLPMRILAPLLDRITAKQSYERLALVVAGWIFYISGAAETRADQHGLVVAAIAQDPLEKQFQAIRHASNGDATDLTRQFLALDSIFSQDLAQHRPLVARVTHYLQQMMARGVLATVADINKTKA